MRACVRECMCDVTISVENCQTKNVNIQFDSFVLPENEKKKKKWKWRFHWPEGEREIKRKMFKYDKICQIYLHSDQMKLCKWISKWQWKPRVISQKIAIDTSHTVTQIGDGTSTCQRDQRTLCPNTGKHCFHFVTYTFGIWRLLLLITSDFWLLWVSMQFFRNECMHLSGWLCMPFGLGCLLWPQKSFPSQELWKNSGTLTDWMSMNEFIPLLLLFPIHLKNYDKRYFKVHGGNGSRALTICVICFPFFFCFYFIYIYLQWTEVLRAYTLLKWPDFHVEWTSQMTKKKLF